MTTFTLFIPRRYAVLYLAWELTPAGANRFIKTLPTDSRGWIGMHAMTLFFPVGKRRHTRKSLENFANRIRNTVAYQEGKLGKPLTAGGLLVTVEVTA